MSNLLEMLLEWNENKVERAGACTGDGRLDRTPLFLGTWGANLRAHLGALIEFYFLPKLSKFLL